MNIGASAGSRAYLRGAAFDFVDTLLQHGSVAFALSDLTAATGLSTVAARRQLARLDGLVRRVAPRQPFLLIVGPEHRVLGAPPAAWWLDTYFRWLRKPYYLALQSAASEYGSAAQSIQVAQVVSDLQRRPLEIGRVRVQFFVKRTVAVTPTQAAENAHAPLRVSTPEATVVDLVRYADRIGGLARVTESVGPFVGRLRRRPLLDVLEADGRPATVEGLLRVLTDLRRKDLARTVREKVMPASQRTLP